MNYPPSRQSESESDPNSESEVASNERTNERTDASDGNGRLSGAGSRRTGAYEKDSHIGYHSQTVAAQLARAREAIRQASAEHHKRDVPDPPPRPATEETA